jgi:hypothetical protein
MGQNVKHIEVPCNVLVGVIFEIKQRRDFKKLACDFMWAEERVIARSQGEDCSKVSAG